MTRPPRDEPWGPELLDDDERFRLTRRGDSRRRRWMDCSRQSVRRRTPRVQSCCPSSAAAPLPPTGFRTHQRYGRPRPHLGSRPCRAASTPSASLPSSVWPYSPPRVVDYLPRTAWLTLSQNVGRGALTSGTSFSIST